MSSRPFDFANANRLATELILGIFQPFVKILLRYHVPYRRVADLLKWAYVHEAAKGATNQGELNISRIAVRTSLCRKEVSRLVKAKEPPVDSHPRRHERIASIINGWRNDPRFCNEKKAPAALPITNGKRSFRKLAETYGADVSYGALMREMIGLGVVSEDSRRLTLEQNWSGAGFVVPDDAVYDCILQVQARWTALIDDEGNIPSLRIRGERPSLEAMLGDSPERFDLQPILAEMIDSGMVVLSDNKDSMCFSKHRFAPRDPSGVLQAVAAGLRHLMLTMANNLACRQTDRWLQTETMLYGLSRARSEQMLKELDDRWEELRETLASKYEPFEWESDEPPVTLGFGVYAFKEAIHPTGMQAPEARRRRQRLSREASANAVR